MNNEKKIMAKSTAEYRGVRIYETDKGVALFLSGKRFDCKDLGEATSLIDAAHVVASRIVETVNLVEEKFALLNG